jgi:murein DD-endopeptidase MepM/ murein hydrolase activator NlpD
VVSGILYPIKGTAGQGFGRPAIRVEPRAYLLTDGASNDRKARWTQFAGARVFDDVHMGDDVMCPIGTAVRAPANGVVLRLSTYRVFNPFANGGKGSYVFAHDIWFGFGGAMLYVAHLGRPFDAGGKTAFVLREGQHALRGQRIAKTGDSGVATGPHGHLEIIQGSKPVYGAAQFRWNPKRVAVGGDLAGLPWLK